MAEEVDSGSVEVETAMVSYEIANVVSRTVRRAILDTLGSKQHSAADFQRFVEAVHMDSTSTVLDRMGNLYADATLCACVSNFANIPPRQMDRALTRQKSQLDRFAS